MLRLCRFLLIFGHHCQIRNALQMNIIDILIGIPLLWVMVKGFKNGFIFEIATLIALVLGIYGAIHFSDFTAQFIRDRFNYDSEYMGYISFGITFIVIVIIVHIIGKLLNSLVEAVALGMFNRILGMVFGLMKGIIIIGIIVYFVDYLDRKFEFISDEKKDESYLYSPMTTVSEKMFELFNSDFSDTKEKIKEKVKKELPLEV
ncbi:CvpA family protein [Labilibaculum sp. 44]|uniref:CvpA family protein n=2 Tax=Marinifilaceae TaxID=1573805 RepID=A0A7M4D4Z0_9BACT|nr:CvpA family protein [Labilibaculum euxinus]MVB06924.1 CvpA family protein [Labilibaculum euxinus]